MLLIGTLLASGVAVIALFLYQWELARTETDADALARRLHDQEYTQAKTEGEKPLTWHRVVAIDQSDDGSYPPRIVLDEDDICIPTDAPRELVHRLYTALDLNPGATIELACHVHPTTLRVTRHGHTRITPPDGEPVTLAPEGVRRVNALLRYDRRDDYLVIDEQGARFPVACNETLIEPVARLMRANDGVVIQLKGTIDPVDLAMTRVHAIHAGVPGD